MTKYILAGGYVNKAEDGGKAFYEELVKGINNKPVKILDCMFARPIEDWEETFKSDQNLFSQFIKDFELELAVQEKFVEQVKNSDVIFLRGGHTQQLFKLLSQDKAWINELDGKVLAGTSAGAQVIAKYYHVLSSSRTGDGFGLLPVKFIPHWKANDFDEIPKDIDWDKALKELKDHKEDLPIYTLAEGEFIVL
jgi:peptidase E